MSGRVDAETRKARSARREDAVAALVVLALAAFILLYGLKIPDSSYSNAILSPRDFPFLTGALMLLAGVALLVRNVSALLPSRAPTEGSEASETPESEPAKDQAPAEDSDDEFETGRAAQDPRILGMLLALLLGYILVFVWLGYVLSTFAFLTASTMLLSPRRPVRNVIFAAALSTAIYLLFTVGLNVRLPPGPLGGLL
ncbi:hypothetical protein CQY20_01530 [Mycolicibacterium agri]|uniref:DUF1468 domain-containing protein n=1 Tax=Mycolicibacterium agri TaxID=36811 RepID=A0A2A7NF09_MYCAG|nr:tripartite tricarboxylate transporter TctB family protein [Mycolicibacterium agri]PEG42702.1 hypothetical protein CQY20_01530 [Mycolicibacterium agri]GFG52685.1 hypothetical protein MAGR_41260 [Mycolicibacterium agri]